MLITVGNLARKDQLGYHIYFPEKILRGHSKGRIQCTINQSFKKLVASGVHVKGKNGNRYSGRNCEVRI